MAAYAALVCLINLTEDIQNHPRLSTSLDKKQIASLGEKVDFLLDFIESYDCRGGSKEAAEDLESHIASAAHAAEDAIESHIVDQIHGGISNKNSLRCFLDLQKVMEAMDYLKEKVMKVEEERAFKYKRPKYPTPAASSTPLSTRKNTLLGVEDELMQLMDVLTGQQSDRRIISIIGMGGIGKTSLAQNVYEDMVIMWYFDLRAWATVSQEYDLREILLELLSSKGEYSTSVTIDLLGERLYKKLTGRRYLIILDDIWSCEVWDKIKFFFPDNGNRSRIVITSRLSNMAIHCGSSSFVMKFLDEHKSWELFCEKAFGEEGCPHELEEIGKMIVKRCRGLPLPIVVIGRHLGKSSGRKEHWESVSNDINSILDLREDQHCLEILSLSYYHLPTHLKPCFLYMGIFPEDKEIYVPYLINLWAAEGMLKPNKSQSLEEVAKDYVNDLVDRNLILVHKWGHDGKIRFVKIHDILRELCIKVAKKEKFYCVLDSRRSMHRADRRVVIDEKIREKKHHHQIIHALQAAPLVRSLQCERCELPFDFRLLKVLNKVEVVLNEGSSEASFQQVNLRYIDCHFVRSKHVFDVNPSPYQSLHIPPSISLLWNLQTLVIGGSYKKIIAPSEIWEMRQLRHVDVSRLCLPDPSQRDRLDLKDNLVFHNLQRLSTVENFRLSEEVCERIPNIKKLQLRYSDEASSGYYPHNLGRFCKLESLRCFFLGQSWYDLARSLSFPSSLRELALVNARLRWKDLATIGWLPHLRDLALINSAFGPEWDPLERGFRSLKLLRIYGCGELICWNGESSHFPGLEGLDLGSASKLNEIPSSIGEITTLQCIKLQSCSVSAAISAVRIVVEQEELGNDGLQLHVHFQKEEEAARFTKMVEEEGLTCNNLRLT